MAVSQQEIIGMLRKLASIVCQIHTIQICNQNLYIILRFQFIGITLSKPHLECTFYDKQINAKKYEWEFGSVQVLLVGDCIYLLVCYELIGE